jgi:hypothetical protein
MIGPNGEQCEALFIPERGRERVCLHPDMIRVGLTRAREYVGSDRRVYQKGLQRITLSFDPLEAQYVVVRVEYADGTDINVA